jgi:hypothetical protein
LPFAEVAWVTILGSYYGAYALFLIWAMLGRLLPLHIPAGDFKTYFRFISVIVGFGLIVGMVWLGQEFYRRKPTAILAARVFISIGLIYSLLAVVANVWVFCIHAHTASLLFLVKSIAMLAGNAILLLYFLKLPRPE